jgi:hypothetical protein
MQKQILIVEDNAISGLKLREMVDALGYGPAHRRDTHLASHRVHVGHGHRN